jgi:hypothetical protein
VILGSGCSNTSSTISAAKRSDMLAVSFSGGEVYAWVADGFKNATPQGWPIFERDRDGNPLPPIDAIWLQFCAHYGDAEKVELAGKQIIYFLRYSGHDQPIYLSGINGYDPPRDDWVKGAVATEACRQAAAKIVAEAAKVPDSKVYAGPDTSSVRLTPAECLKDGTSPHPNKEGQKKLAAVVAPFDFGGGAPSPEPPRPPR